MQFAKKPKLIIAGVHKAATTSLFEYLSMHPNISPGNKKEIHFYTPLRYANPVGSVEDYSLNFDKDIDGYLLDASPSYLYGGKKIAERIKSDNPNTKVIIILRNPSDRFVSFYKFLISEFRLDKDISLNDFIELSFSKLNKEDSDDIYSRAFREGCYSKFIEEWIDIFQDDLKVIFFDHIKQNPKEIMLELSNWLKIDPNIYKNHVFLVSNKTIASRFKFIFRLANFLNMRFELWLRKHLRVKFFLKHIYFLINGTKNVRQDDPDFVKAKSRVDELYLDFNAELEDILKTHNVRNLPDWCCKKYN